MDIRSFFGKETKPAAKPTKDPTKRRAVLFIDDDDDEENEFKPDKKKTKQKTRSSSRILYDSDNEDNEDTKVETSKEKKVSKVTLPPSKVRKELTSIDEFFGSAPVTHTKSKKPYSSSSVKEKEVPVDVPHPLDDDESISPHSLDEPQSSQLQEEKPPLAKKLKQSLEAFKNNPPTKTTTPPTKATTPPTKATTPPTKSITPPTKLSATPSKVATPPVKTAITPTKVTTPSIKQVTPPTKATTPPVQSSSHVSPAVPEVPTRKMSYREYLNREGPKAPGSKVIPQGSDNCLFGLTFVFTGVGESLDRDESSELVKKYGGRVTTSLSKKTDYIVIGEGAGESKLKKAKSLGTKQINEDEFLDLIRSRPGKSSVPTPTVTPKQSHKRKTTSPHTPTTPTSRNAPINQTTPTSSKQIKPTVTTPTRIPSPKGLSHLLWVDKYSPVNCKHIIGQQGKKSNVNKLIDWLKNWYTYFGPNPTKKPTNTNDGSIYKAALLSGPPGVGKTTSAILVCKEVGYPYTELNASATRSKKSLQHLLSDSLNSHSLDTYLSGGGTSQRHVFIMDEVDGMGGNEDRGGVQELIQLIKTSHVPVICICNDRHHTKIRSLANHCFDLRFTKPKMEQIRGPMMSVAYKEGIKVTPQVMQELIIASNNDIRQVLHNLSMLSAAESANSESFKQSITSSAKTCINKSPFDIVKKVFQPFESGKEMSIREKTELFFTDYSFMPLFVQENYLQVKPTSQHSKIQILHSISTAADSIAHGDLISTAVRSDSAWQLLPTQAIFSSVLPGEAIRGVLERPNFPTWLGNNSKYSKNDRLLQQLQQHTRLSCSCNKLEFLLNYSPFLCSKLTHPLISQGTDGVHEVVDMLSEYDLTKDDWENLVELNQYSGRQQVLSLIDTKVKTAFTKYYNKADIQLPYTIEKTVKKRRATQEGDEYSSEGEESDSDDWTKFAVKKVTKDKASKDKGPSKTSSGNSKGKRHKNKT